MQLTARLLGGWSPINRGKNFQQEQRPGKEPRARILRLSYFCLSLQPPENKKITNGGAKVKRKDNVQFLKEQAQMQLIHEVSVHGYVAFKVWGTILQSTLERTEVLVNVFISTTNFWSNTRMNFPRDAQWAPGVGYGDTSQSNLGLKGMGWEFINKPFWCS